MKTYYDLLNVSPTANDIEISAAYNKLSHLNDRHIDKAFVILSNQYMRGKYDEKLKLLQQNSLGIEKIFSPFLSLLPDYYRSERTYYCDNNGNTTLKKIKKTNDHGKAKTHIIEKKNGVTTKNFYF